MDPPVRRSRFRSVLAQAVVLPQFLQSRADTEHDEAAFSGNVKAGDALSDLGVA